MARDAFQRGFIRFALPAFVSPGVLGPAALPQNRILPESLQHLRRLLEARMGNRGKREFIQVLRPREFFPNRPSPRRRSTRSG
jgi:hypothetical protein